jgi:hypothetical protein
LRALCHVVLTDKCSTFRAPRSLFCFSLKNPIRKACIALSESKRFEHFILVTILGTVGATTPSNKLRQNSWGGCRSIIIFLWNLFLAAFKQKTVTEFMDPLPESLGQLKVGLKWGMNRSPL